MKKIDILTKEEFLDHINELKTFTDMLNAIYEVTDGGLSFIEMNTLESNVTSLLSSAMGDKSDWVSYWVWELEFGKRYRPGTVTYDGEDIDISTAEKLYDMLARED